MLTQEDLTDLEFALNVIRATLEKIKPEDNSIDLLVDQGRLIVTEFNGRKPVKWETTPKKKDSLCSIGQWLVHSLDSGAFEADPDTGTLGQPRVMKWDGFMSSGFLYESYLYFCKLMKKGRTTSSIKEPWACIW